MATKFNLENHKAVILAGGRGTRLYPVTKEIPKPLLPVKKKPIINYLVDLFYSQGVKEIAVLINKDFREDFEWWEKRYYPSVSSPYQNKFGTGQAGQVPQIKLVQELEPLGTFGGLCFLKDWIGKSSFFLTNGDELKKINLGEMSKFHQQAKTLATIALVKVSDPQHYGVVISKNGKVEEFLEKPKVPPTNYINSGLYLLSPEIFKGHPGSQFSMVETDLFPKLAKEGKLGGFKFQGKWTDCGTWDRYNDALNKWK